MTDQEHSAMTWREQKHSYYCIADLSPETRVKMQLLRKGLGLKTPDMIAQAVDALWEKRQKDMGGYVKELHLSKKLLRRYWRLYPGTRPPASADPPPQHPPP